MEKTARLVLTLPRSIRILLYSAITFGSFAIPFSLSQNQIITGTFVNAALIASVIMFPGRLFLPIIFLPSLAVLSRGMIFGPFTPFLIYFLPMIWLGNFVLVSVFKKCLDNLGYSKSLVIGGIAKYLLLFLTANLYYKFHLVPGIFVKTMGILQLATVISGGVIVYFCLKGLRGRN